MCSTNYHSLSSAKPHRYPLLLVKKISATMNIETISNQEHYGNHYPLGAPDPPQGVKNVTFIHYYIFIPPLEIKESGGEVKM